MISGIGFGAAFESRSQYRAETVNSRCRVQGSRFRVEVPGLEVWIQDLGFWA